MYESLAKSLGKYYNPTSVEWLRNAYEFIDNCKIPNCVGSIDGKHCRISCPPNAGTLFFNYKSCFTVNLLGVADASCCFTLIDVGAHGRENDSSAFRKFWKGV
jgi:hypothetical protein